MSGRLWRCDEIVKRGRSTTFVDSIPWRLGRSRLFFCRAKRLDPRLAWLLKSPSGEIGDCLDVL
jgi:hypothetical protein